MALTAVAQVDYPNFEIVVVADAKSMAAVRAHPLADLIKTVVYDTPNISGARNAGIAVTAGDIVAFIDDDAVAEPSWLGHLTGPFTQADVVAVGGYVIGRNGISFQWKARTVDRDAGTAELALDSDAPQVFTGTPDCAIKTEGTNMAVRREILVDIGGFDPAFEFYLDETDLNMRLGQAGLRTAIAPLARVHHGFAASGRRRADRAPTDLTQIGASIAVFLRKHGGRVDQQDVHRQAQRVRLLKHMVAGRLYPAQVTTLLAGFDHGWAQGMARGFGHAMPLSQPFVFQRITPVGGTMHFVTGRVWQKRRMLHQAAKDVRRGQRVTVIILSATALFHRMRFLRTGVWFWTGGQFGKAQRSEPVFQIARMATRAKAIALRLSQGRAS